MGSAKTNFYELFPREKSLEIFKYLHDKVMQELAESKDEVFYFIVIS